MLGLFGFDIYDVFDGKTPIRVAFAYINRLTVEPWSKWRAMQLGGLEHLGWTPDTYKQADLLDATLMQAAITGNIGSKKPAKMPDPTFRPKVKEQPKEEKVESLADFNIHAMMAAMGG